MTNYTEMSGGEMLQACGTDAAKWAACLHAEQGEGRA